ncbi:MAG: hypothetical protein J4432_03390 [DPANN group archaeon]|nr:hypothetical protein [DPANN group archaeon]
MSVETVRMSSKGQIVIPQSTRAMIHATEGTVFAVISSADMVILKRIDLPSKEELISKLKSIAKQGKKRLEARGIREEDIQGIIEKQRRR